MLTAQDTADHRARRRAGIALLLLVPAPSVGVLASMWLIPGPVGQTIYWFAKLWLLALPAVWWFWIVGGAWSWSPPTRGGFGVAIALGLAMSAAIVGGYGFIGRHVIDAAQVRDVVAAYDLDQPGAYLAFAAYITLINAALEEYVWRWFVFRQCETLLGRVRHAGALAVLAAAGCFTLHHVIALAIQFGPLVTVLGSLGVFVGGAVWSWLYLRYRSIWPAYVSHAIVDVAVFVVGWWIIFGNA